MFRLTPPTKSTFGLAIAAIVAGIAVQLGVVDAADLTDFEDVAFWLTAGGGLLMALGVLFKRI